MRPVDPRIRSRAAAMRGAPTEWEAALWQELRNRRLGGLKFRRQVAIGSYIVDFACNERRLIIELDGAQHQEDAAQAYDARRTAWLHAQGYTVLRFPNDDVLHDLDGVCSHIAAVAAERQDTP